MCYLKEDFSKLLFLPLLLLLPAFGFGQLAEIVNVTQWCDRVGGSITVEILDGQPYNYDYYWSHDNTQLLTVDNLEPGTYYFFIQDKKTGCSQTLETQIGDFTSCTSHLSANWNTDECVLELDLTFQSGGIIFGLSEIDPSFVIVDWDIQNLSGSSVEVQLEQGVSTVQVCYDYRVQGSGPGGALSCCSGTECHVLTNPEGPTLCSAKGSSCALKINEVHAKSGESFIELVVTGENGDCEKGCDLRNVIIDDNNGDLIGDIYRGITFSEKIDEGYIKFNDNAAWSDVPLGSLIVLHEDSKSDDFFDDPTDADGDKVYSLWIRNQGYLAGFTRSAANTVPYYEFNGFPTDPVWNFIDVDLGYDGLQIQKSSAQSKSHALLFGHDSVATVSSSGTVPIEYAPTITTGISVALAGGSYDLSGGYTVSPALAGSSTPGLANTVDNSTFIEGLRNCTQSKAAGASPAKKTSDFITYDVFPNPTNGKSVLSITSTAPTTFDLIIRSVSGQVLIKETISVGSAKSTMRLPEQFGAFPAGLYFIDLVTDGQSVGVKKIVLTK